MNINADNIMEALQHGVSHQQAGRIKEAEDIYNQVLAIEPDNEHANNFLGMIAAMSGNYQLAVDFLNRATQTGRPTPERLTLLRWHAFWIQMESCSIALLCTLVFQGIVPETLLAAARSSPFIRKTLRLSWRGSHKSWIVTVNALTCLTSEFGSVTVRGAVFAPFS